jgi:Mrp family chromosome partitioning ATPase
MPAGNRDGATADLVTAERVAALFEKLNGPFAGHAVVIDTPPILASSEAQSLIDAAGQALLVIRAGVTTPDAVRDAVGRIAEDVPVGAVLNAWVPISPSERKAYEHYGDYGEAR